MHHIEFSSLQGPVVLARKLQLLR